VRVGRARERRPGHGAQRAFRRYWKWPPNAESIEPPDEREAAGKPLRGSTALTASEGPEGLLIAIEDDGRGVDWGRVAERAAGAGLPHGTRGELCEALF
jgi:hypothetical protein